MQTKSKVMIINSRSYDGGYLHRGHRLVVLTVKLPDSVKRSKFRRARRPDRIDFQTLNINQHLRSKYRAEIDKELASVCSKEINDVIEVMKELKRAITSAAQKIIPLKEKTKTNDNNTDIKNFVSKRDEIDKSSSCNQLKKKFRKQLKRFESKLKMNN